MQSGGVARVICTGELDFYDSKEFGAVLQQAMADAEDVAVDLKGAYYIDTAITAKLAFAGRAMMERGKRLRVLLTMGSQPRRTLNLAGLSILIDLIVED